VLSHQEEIDFLSFVSDKHDTPFHQVLDSFLFSWNELPVTLILAEQQLLFAANATLMVIINSKHCMADVHFWK